MNDFIAARSQMALSLGFHIIFSCIGMVMPFLMYTAHCYWLKTKDPIYKELTRAWSRGVAIFFATGAVSGTALSFELGLLWPGFMSKAGPIFGMPFSLEGIAFFIEAIALGFFLYGWERLNPWFHWLTGLVVGISGLLSGILVVSANSWMNSPAGFDFTGGKYINIDPVKAMFNDAWFEQALHMSIAAFAATGFAVAGLHALMIFRRKNIRFHTKAFRIAIVFAAAAAILQPLSGDISARSIAKRQPAKLAAMESHFKTESYAPLIIGGIPDVKAKKVNYDIEIKGLLSFMAFHDFKAKVIGLDQIKPEDQPPVSIVHYAFQIMVGLGMLMIALAMIYFFALIRKKDWFGKKWFLLLFSSAMPIGFIALEAGWTVTEVGRQPWIIQGIMRTKDAVTPMPGIMFTFYLITAVYLSLGMVLIFLLYRLMKTAPEIYEIKNIPGKTKKIR